MFAIPVFPGCFDLATIPEARWSVTEKQNNTSDIEKEKDAGVFPDCPCRHLSGASVNAGVRGNRCGGGRGAMHLRDAGL